MARTKASAGAKVASGKSSKARCSVVIPASSSGSSGSSDRAARGGGGGGGGNSVCPRETPKWQKPITKFFICKEPERGSDSEDEGVKASSSKPEARRAVIESDEEQATERPKNKVLDDSIELEPLTGEDSHKIEEYYPTNGIKGKGKGKKTKDKENIDNNVERRNSVKRDLEEVTFGEESEQPSKRVKVN